LLFVIPRQTTYPYTLTQKEKKKLALLKKERSSLVGIPSININKKH
jgi:hypothetical protein